MVWSSKGELCRRRTSFPLLQLAPCPRSILISRSILRFQRDGPMINGHPPHTHPQWLPDPANAYRAFPVLKYLPRIISFAPLPTFVSSYRELLSRKSIGALITGPQFIRASTVITLPEPRASGPNNRRQLGTGQCKMLRVTLA